MTEPTTGSPEERLSCGASFTVNGRIVTCTTDITHGGRHWGSTGYWDGDRQLSPTERFTVQWGSDDRDSSCWIVGCLNEGAVSLNLPVEFGDYEQRSYCWAHAKTELARAAEGQKDRPITDGRYQEKGASSDA